jgi:hypothetical protein
VAVDFDDDGWPDLFVARDASPNLLLLNKHDGTFTDAGLEAEIAFDRNGNARAGMGVDAADVDGDGRPDVVVTNFNFEFHSLFLNRAEFPFEDWTRASGLAGPTRANVGWGAHFIDYDNDGMLDLMIVNGHVIEVIERLRSGVMYKEKPLLLRNTGNAVFEDVRSQAGAVFSQDYLARGLAIGDWDNDGAPDAIFTCIGDRPVLLHNDVGPKNSWIGVRLTGTKSNRDAIGAKLMLDIAGKKLVRWITGGSSYLSTHDKRILFGLGVLPANRTVDIEILWPNGGKQAVAGLKINQYHQITEK